MHITGTPTEPQLEGALATVADEPHSFPCRRCLTDAEPGESVLLISYDPWKVASPYRQSGPVFLHERACETAVLTELPEQQRRRLLSVRAYDRDGMVRSTFVVEGAGLDLDEVLADPEVDFVHLHNAAAGCFAARVDR